ncbi:MAG: NAD(P)H-hydrate dehydratase [Gammaproteobacteria bacterium]|nr:NAD(P)H-hydrate dehydratase [Gammaproteobacteria bacterium]
MNDPSTALYAAAQVRELDRRAIAVHGIAGGELMRRAAAAAWGAVRRRWPHVRRVAVICGSGNNGGDGYALARLAVADGCQVQVYAVAPPAPGSDAERACAAWRAVGGEVRPWDEDTGVTLARAELVVDALFGTGLSRAPQGSAQRAIEAINAVGGEGPRFATPGCGDPERPAREGRAGVERSHRRCAADGGYETYKSAKVLALDLPSGLFADTGAAPGAAVSADLTVTFIAPKLGLYTGAGPRLCGEIRFESLDVPAAIYEGIEPAARLAGRDDLRRWLPPRARDGHKGRYGYVLVIGGEHGMAGAALLAARAALRAGAGLVSVATRHAHAHVMVAAQPEAMWRGVESAGELAPLLEHADVVALGPGLGRDAWGKAMLAAVIDAPRLVVDADALNLLAERPRRRNDWVLTPHPGEAARLLGCDTAAVQADRPAALRALAQRYGGTPLLKGAGSLVFTASGIRVCPFGNPGMAAGGMGDALTGVIAAFLAQGLTPDTAASAGVLAHALAGDRAAAAGGERGLSALDLIAELRAVVNP